MPACSFGLAQLSTGPPVVLPTPASAAPSLRRSHVLQEGLDGDGEWTVEALDEDMDEDLGDDWDDDEGDGADIWEFAAGAAAGGAAAAGKAAGRASAAAANAKGPGSKALASLPRHVLRELDRQHREAEEEAAKLKPSERKKAAARQKTHRGLRIISGTAAGAGVQVEHMVCAQRQICANCADFRGGSHARCHSSFVRADEGQASMYA